MHPQKTVLLVEDDEDDQELFTSALNEIDGVTLVSIATNGKEAIETLRKSPVLPSMIFMDINMPIMDGIECLRRIMSDPLMNEIPVVILSSESYYNEKARNLGAVGFIKKQITISDLRDELKQNLEAIEKKKQFKTINNIQ